jgi:hypothetical protein
MQSPWQKTKTAVSGLFRALGTVAALGGLLTALVDYGATFLITSKLSATIALHVPGGLALAVAGGGVAGAYVGFQLRAIELNTLPYLSRMFALACDAFGVPRRLNGGQVKVSFGMGMAARSFTLPDPQLPEQAVKCPLEKSLQLWQFDPARAAWNKTLADD